VSCTHWHRPGLAIAAHRHRIRYPPNGASRHRQRASGDDRAQGAGVSRVSRRPSGCPRTRNPSPRSEISAWCSDGGDRDVVTMIRVSHVRQLVRGHASSSTLHDVEQAMVTASGGVLRVATGARPVRTGRSHIEHLAWGARRRGRGPRRGLWYRGIGLVGGLGLLAAIGSCRSCSTSPRQRERDTKAMTMPGQPPPRAGNDRCRHRTITTTKPNSIKERAGLFAASARHG